MMQIPVTTIVGAIFILTFIVSTIILSEKGVLLQKPSSAFLYFAPLNLGFISLWLGYIVEHDAVYRFYSELTSKGISLYDRLFSISVTSTILIILLTAYVMIECKKEQEREKKKQNKSKRIEPSPT